MVTRAKYEQVYMLYVDFGWTPRMMAGMVDLKPWEIGAIVEGINNRQRVENGMHMDDRRDEDDNQHPMNTAA